MKNTQGIYTDNMYIGDKDQYIAFYTDALGNKHLDIIGSSIDIALNDGEKIIQTINNNGNPNVQINANQINTENMTIGNTEGMHIKVDDTEIQFWQGNEATPENKSAYINGERMFIPYTVVLNQMEVGMSEDEKPLWAWQVTPDDHLRLVWLGQKEESN